MTTTTDEGFHEIQLNGKQLVFLFMAVTVVSVVIFLCGVLVGRGVRPEQMTGVPLTAQAEAPAVPDAIPTASTPGSGSPATANEQLSYPQRLASRAPAREQLKATPAPSAEPPAVPARAPETQRPAPAVAPAEDTPVTGGPAEPAGAGFAIQITALAQRAEADRIARSLTTKGYPAYVMTPDSGAPAVFRVRVGKFKDRREAESVAARLEKEEQFKPWIVR